MSNKRRLPVREYVFILSLMHHGFRLSQKRRNLKHKRGYVIPSTWREDASGIDLWVKMPREHCLVPVQIAQRGVRLYRKYEGKRIHRLSQLYPDRCDELWTQYHLLVEKNDGKRNYEIRRKKQRCLMSGIAFVLVRDYDGSLTNRSVAWGDIKALRYGIAHLRRWL